jgi:hypothetical protein
MSIGEFQQQRSGPVERTLSRRALLSLALALLGALFGVLLAPLCCSLAAVVLGRSARRRIAADPRQRGSRLAGAAVMLGVLGLLFWTLVWVAYLSSGPGGGHIGGAGGFL